MGQDNDPPSEKPGLSVASILSDLTSLGACDFDSAMALVSASPGSSQQENHARTQARSNDPDLKRAFDLTAVYHSVKLNFSTANKDSTTARTELQRSRIEVAKAIESLRETP